jgi:hypothetical protein
MKTIIHNGCKFTKVNTYNDKAVIEITPMDGTFLSGESEQYVTVKIADLTTNFGGGFEEWVKDQY